MDFNHLFILECFAYKNDREFFNLFTVPSMKDFNISTGYQWLRKNEYLVEDPNDTSKWIISVKGQDFIDNLQFSRHTSADGTQSATTIVVNYGKTPDECFEEWWKAYPTSPAWKSDDGQVAFVGSRTLKNLTKAKAKKAYLKLLNQGLVHEQLVGALLYEIQEKKKDSLKKNANQMDYFKGMESYLNQERYLAYVELYKQNPGAIQAIKGKKANVTDI